MTGKIFLKLYLDSPVVVVSPVPYYGEYYNNPKKE